MPDFNITTGGFYDLNKDGYKEFIFAIHALLSKEPRALYAFDIHNKILMVNDVKYAPIDYPVINYNTDIGHVITVSNNTPENAPGPYEKYYSDSLSYLFVFNDKLEFLFPPVVQTKKKSNICSIAINEDGELFIYAIFNGETNHDTSWLLKYNRLGELVGRKRLSNRNYDFFSYEDEDSSKIVLYNVSTNITFEVSSDLDFIGMKNDVLTGDEIHQFDINNDGKLELITCIGDLSKIFVYQKGFMHPIAIDFPKLDASNFIVSKCNFEDGGANLYFQSKGIGQYLFYTKNPYYYFKFPFYLVIYLFISLFLHILLKLQRTNLQKKYEQEKRMTELELLTIKNQIDPHFTFNAINTLSSFFYEGDKKTAHEFLVDFSTLIRNTLNNSKKISITLKDEIEFVENYLKLQQFRYVDKFDFSFQIEITDDGIGRKKSKQVQNYKQISTGHGHTIIRQIVEMYNRLNGTEVNFEISDLKNANRRIIGTKVIIII